MYIHDFIGIRKDGSKIFNDILDFTLIKTDADDVTRVSPHNTDNSDMNHQSASNNTISHPNPFVKKYSRSFPDETPDEPVTEQKESPLTEQPSSDDTDIPDEQNKLSEHTPEQLEIMREYASAVDDDILNFISYSRANPNDNRTILTLSGVTKRAVADIKELTGIDVDGFEHSMKTNTIRHIDGDHGIKGSTDHSMSDDKDIARIQYVLDNYDSVELLPKKTKNFATKTNTWHR